MKTTAKIVLSILLIAVFVLAVGCDSTTPTEYAKKVVNETYKSYQDGTFDDLEVESVPEGAKDAFKRIEYEIVSTKEINDKKVEVKVKTKALDFKVIMQNYISEAMTIALDPEISKLPEKELETKMQEILIKHIKDEKIALVDNEATLTIILKDKKWQIEDEDVLAESILAGYSEVADSLK